MVQDNLGVFDSIKQRSLEAISHLDIKEGRSLLKELDFQLGRLPEVSVVNKERTTEYFNLLARLKLLTLAFLKDEEAIQLFKTKAIEVVNDSDIDLFDRVEMRQLLFTPDTVYEMVNQPIIEALHQNLETIGKEKIFVSGNPEAKVPTVANWLLDYDRTYGTQPQKDLVWLEYVNSGENASRLDGKEKETLRKLLKFYEFLKREYVSEQ